jgi:periplasmic divalent cation tolerance protein
MNQPGTLDLLWCSFPDVETANAAAAILVGDGDVACAQVMPPMTAHFHWQGTQEIAVEVPMLCKIAAGRGGDVASRIATLHPYELPAISWWSAHCSPALAAWTRDA